MIIISSSSSSIMSSITININAIIVIIVSINIINGNDKANNCFISHVKYMTSTPAEEQATGYTAPTKLAAIL